MTQPTNVPQQDWISRWQRIARESSQQSRRAAAQRPYARLIGRLDRVEACRRGSAAAHCNQVEIPCAACLEPS